MSVVVSRAPWIVGRTVRLEHAAEDFLNEVTRQQPWHRARFEALLEDLDDFLGGAAPLSALTDERSAAWQGGLDAEDRETASLMLREFTAYLLDWHWVS
ncbi:hypothetical protein DEDE109153_12320 [Deinococcus deserti]|uniref:Uncharacterized protein n=1 Tax=Deinococcus deserti (strain DSM 17065 / CIP 109153 / LMG 22923 / VCD115) TaxID=546414 RepID=C1D2S5_DEIDV|nr:hypothetical protein [Deinococcus deserti]ACO47714.2 hypothetical protein Deide_2p00550 [Deinococcus deserti VCD115]